MPRYIDAEKIEIRVPYGYNNDGEILVPLAAVRQSIAQTPSEDVVEVVRCKDCRFCDSICANKRCGEEAVTDYYCNIYDELVDDDYFCSMGSRKEQT